MSTVKIGFLASGSGGNPSGVGDYVNKLDAAGIPAVVMCNDGVVGISDALAQIKAGSTVPHVMAYRIVKDASERWSVPNYSLSPKEAAVEYRDRLMPFINPVVKENRDRVWVLIGNELDKGRSDWLGYWGYESALLWNQAGYKVALFGFSSGEPEPEHWQTSGMLQFLQLASQRLDQVAINLHEYSYDVSNILNIYPWLIGRFQFMYKACDLHGIPRPKILFGEWGWELDKTPPPGPGTTDVHNVADIYAPFANILGGGLWYLGQYLNFNIHKKAQPLIAPVTELAQSYSPRSPFVELMISPDQPPIGVAGPSIPDGSSQPGGGPGDGSSRPGEGEIAVEEKLIDLAFTGLGVSDIGVARASWFDQGNVQVPIKLAGRQRWNYWEAEGDNPFGDGQPWNDFRSPEGVHRWDAHLPAHEHVYLNSHGRFYHLFAPEGAWWARFNLDQRLTPGRYRLNLDLWGDWVDLVKWPEVPKPDPRHAQLELFVGQEGREEWITPPFAEQSVQVRDFVVDSEGDYEVGFGILTVFAPGGRMAANGCFLRGFTLERLTVPVDEEPEEPVGSTLAKYLWGASLPYDLNLNSAAALQGAIFADGFIPIESERSAHFAGKKYIIQAAEHLATGERRLYFVEVPHWADIRFLNNPFGGQPGERPVEEPEEPPVEQPTETPAGQPGDFKYEFWPTKVMRVTQGFGENTEDYGPFLPGHEGIDLSSPMGTPYFAPKAGKVNWASDRRRSDGQLSLYGWHVIIDHGDGYSSLLAHALPNPPVAIGDMVAAGQIVAYSGNTGNSSGPHLHLTLKKAGHQLEGWPPGYMDPWPHLSHLLEQIPPPADPVTEGYLFNDYLEDRNGELAITTDLLNIRAKPFQMGRLLGTVREGATVRRLRSQLENGYQLAEVSIPDIINYKPLPAGGGVDMLSYMRGDPGIMFEVRHPNGAQERFHTQDDPRNQAAWFYVKNALWEHWRVEGNFIRICSDVSPGDADDGTARYYIVRQNGTYGSPYCPRMMAEGDIYHDGGHFVQFYRKSNNDPHPQNSGFTSNTTTLVKHHGRFTFNSYGQNITLDDVIEVRGNTETHFFAQHQGVSYGRVAWASPWGRSEISEIYAPGTRQPFGRLIIAGMILK